jgi:aspartate/methionine/tyrosine aminotransferase
MIDSPHPQPRLSARMADISGRGADAWAIADRAADDRAAGLDVISLCLGDTSFDTPAEISAALIHAVQTGRTHYAPVPGTPGLRRAIAAAQTRHTGLPAEAGQVTVFGGAQNALFAALMAVAGPGDAVVLLAPWYATYEATAKATGASIVAVPIATAATGTRIDPAVLQAGIGPAVRAIILNGPNNPGGHIFGPADLQTIADLAVRHDLWVISDEVYRTSVFDSTFQSIAALPGMAARTIIVNSLSKSHAMTGWRLGWTIAPTAAALALENMAQCMLFGSPTFIQDAAEIALSPELDQAMSAFAAALHGRRDLMASALAGIDGLRFQTPEGGMFCFVDVSATGLDGGTFADRLYAATGLAVVPGFAFGPAMHPFIRLSFSADEATITEGMTRLRDFMVTCRNTTNPQRR